MSLLKDLYSPSFYKRLTEAIGAVLPSFNKQRFLSQIFTDDFSGKELKARMKHTTRVLHSFLPSDMNDSVKIILQVIRELKKKGVGEDGLAYIFLPDYIETYGIDDFEISVKAIEEITKFVSCEFAVRPFIIRYESRMMNQMKKWSVSSNEKVRRLASEGSRPRLPWAMAIPELKRDPAPVLPILENLKRDPSESVRRSVANNLNDIAKDHPEIVIRLARKWKGLGAETDAIIKHGSRTLLKKGHLEILKHYGLKSECLDVTAFKILTPSVNMGDTLKFSFLVSNTSRVKQTVRLEYGLYFNKANGQLTRKIFKISEKVYQPGQETVVEKAQSFRKITTRVYYPGKHQVSVIVNGEEKVVRGFTVK